MAARGRPSKYLTHVQPRLDEIKTMCHTMTEEQIAETIGVSISAWCEYKKHFPELAETIKKGRLELVPVLRSTLIRKAQGFTYTEKKTIIEMGVVVREEITEKASLPDVAALNLLLKNYDAENWANDPQTLKLRERELELKEMQFESGNWCPT